VGDFLRKLAPQPGLEPGTLRLTVAAAGTWMTSYAATSPRKNRLKPAYAPLAAFTPNHLILRTGGGTVLGTLRLRHSEHAGRSRRNQTPLPAERPEHRFLRKGQSIAPTIARPVMVLPSSWRTGDEWRKTTAAG